MGKDGMAQEAKSEKKKIHTAGWWKGPEKFEYLWIIIQYFVPKILFPFVLVFSAVLGLLLSEQSEREYSYWDEDTTFSGWCLLSNVFQLGYINDRILES